MNNNDGNELATARARLLDLVVEKARRTLADPVTGASMRRTAEAGALFYGDGVNLDGQNTREVLAFVAADLMAVSQKHPNRASGAALLGYGLALAAILAVTDTSPSAQ